jgi:CRISPR-associated protein Cmr5
MNAVTTPQVIEQLRAAYALQRVQENGDKPSIKNSELKSYIKRLPAMVQMNGLGQALAFYKAKSDNSAYAAVYDLASDWLCGLDKHSNHPKPVYGDHKTVLDGITKENQRKYQIAQAELQALLLWAKKFADAFLKDEETSKEGV